MSEFRATALRPWDDLWPQCLTERLGKEGPLRLHVFGSLALLAPTKKLTRVTKDSAFVRNKFVAAMADEAYIAHISLGGQTERIAHMLSQWQVQVL